MAFERKKFLITGGTAGIGQQLALDLLAQGAQVMICGRNEVRLAELKAAHPKLATTPCDVRQNQDVVALRDAALAHFGVPDVLINNAAIFRRFDLQDQSLDVNYWLDEIDINVMGVLRVRPRNAAPPCGPRWCHHRQRHLRGGVCAPERRPGLLCVQGSDPVVD